MSTNIVNTDATIKSRLSKTNQVAAEQTKDGTLVQLKAKIQREAYSEELLRQDVRYRHNLRNADRVVLRDEVLARQYFDKTGQIQYYQFLMSQHLVTELMESVHEQAHKHPGIAKMLQEIRQKYSYPGITKLVKKWVQCCETSAKENEHRMRSSRLSLSIYQNWIWDLRMQCKLTSYPFYHQLEDITAT